MIVSLFFLAATTITTNMAQLNAIKKEITVTEKQIDYENKKIAKLKNDLRRLNRKIKLSKQKVKKKSNYSKKLNSKINKISLDKKLLERLRQKANSQTRDSIKRLYERFVGKSSSSEEFIVKNLTILYFLYKDNLVKKLKEAEKEKKNYLMSLKRRKNFVETIKRKIEKEMITEDRLAKKRKRLVAAEIAGKNRLLLKKRRLEKKKNYLEKILKQLAKKRRYRKLEKIKKIPTVKIARNNPFLRYKGKLPPPVNGKVEKRFGIYKDRDYNVYIKHTGIEIAAKANSYIRAVANGKVVYRGSVLGYGKTVIIKHRGDFFTIYGRLKKITIGKGKIVRAKTIIGTAGKRIYFGIRYKDKAVNPDGWIRRQHK